MKQLVSKWRGQRTGCIYSEWTLNGKHPHRSELHNPGVVSKKFRWVGEITYHHKRFRFRSTSHSNVRAWLSDMVNKYGRG